MSDSSLAARRKILAFAALTELGTGLVLVLDPPIIGGLLLGEEISGVGTLLARCFGIALLALGAACWPSGPRAESRAAPFRGMLLYNALVALYLGYLGTVHQMAGLLLWPAVALHAVVALLLARTWRS